MTLAQGCMLLSLLALLTAIGQICFKKISVLESTFVRKLLHPIFWLGGILFVCCPVLSSLAAKVVDFSIMYALTSLNVVFVLILSRLLLKEKIDRPKSVGVLIVILGLLVLVSA